MSRLTLDTCRAVGLFFTVLLVGAQPARANFATVAQYTAGTFSSAPLQYAAGQSLTTAGTTANTFDNLRFTFYADAGATPSSAGHAFIFTSPYAGSPGDLNASTPGLLAESTGIAGGAYLFSPSVSLVGGTQYFIYTDTAIPIGAGNSNGYAGGQAYAQYTPLTGPDYAPVPGGNTDFDFMLTSGVPPIVAFTGGSTVVGSPFYVGQSVTTPTGGPIDQISFNFYADAASLTPTAAGNLFVLSDEYLGTPDGLNRATTPGFVAESTGIVDGVYQFDPSVTLQGGTTYYFVSDTALPTFSVSAGDPDYAGGNLYSVPPGSNDYAAGPGDLNFALNGAAAEPVPPVAGVPTPETLSLLGVGIAAALVARRRRAAGGWSIAR